MNFLDKYEKNISLLEALNQLNGIAVSFEFWTPL